MDFLKHFLELLAAHILAGIVLAIGGFFLTVKLWQPAKRYWDARKWLERAVRVGVRNFYPSRESYSHDRPLAFVDYLASSKASLSYFGHWLAFTVDQHSTLETLCEMATAGRDIELVLLHPDLPRDVLVTYARYLGEDAATLHGQITDTWRRVLAAHSGLAMPRRRNLKLRGHIEFIPYSAFWFDRTHDGEHILIDMKIFGASRREAYGMELYPTESGSSRYPSLFSRYAESLAKLRDFSREYSGPLP